MVIVTGGAGFIGSHLVQGLNRHGVDDIIIIDEIDQPHKMSNLSGCHFQEVIPIAKFPDLLHKDKFGKAITAIFHQGAITDTLDSDVARFMACNCDYSRKLLTHAVRRRIPFIYASSAAVYGAGPVFSEDPANETPLNCYGLSKLYFDRTVRNILPTADSTVVGLRYFNVYGGNEQHKGGMASMVFQTGWQLQQQGRVHLFKGTDGVPDGEQRRDFVYVEDVVDVNLFVAGNDRKLGIYNVGTGRTHSFNEVAGVWTSLLGAGETKYVTMPEHIRKTYQNFTQADLTKLRRAGYTKDFVCLEDGIANLYGDWRRSSRAEPEAAST